MAVNDLAPAWQRSYSKMILMLHPIVLSTVHSQKKLRVFVASLPLHEGSTMWEIELTREQRVQRWLPGELQESARHAHTFSRGLLSHAFHSEPNQDVTLTQLVTTPNHGSKSSRFPTCILGSVFEPVGKSVQYLWRNGEEIFAVDTKLLRILQSPHSESLQIGPHRWTVELAWHPRPSDLWAPLWKDYRAAVENYFLWQLMYRILTTNHWRFPLAGQAQPETWCLRCPDRALKDGMHCFWTCAESREVWEWIWILVQRSVSSQSSYVTLTAAQALLGRRLPRHHKIPDRWWQILRA